MGVATTQPAKETYYRPISVAEALNIASQLGDDFTYIAGGTDVMVNRQQENETASCLVDISGIEELQQVTVEGQTLKIGALVKLDQLKHYPEIQENFPVLIEAAEAVGSPLIRKTGTIGGNLLCENRCVYYNHSAFWREAVNYCLKSGGDICIASGGPKACFSEFVSDTAPALICLDAQVEIVDTTGTELKPLESIYTGDGLKPRNLPKTALLAFIHLSLNASYQAVFKKLRPRSGVDFTSLTTAVSLNGENRLKIAVGGVSPGPVVVEAPADTDREQLIRQVLKGCKTVDNDVFSRNYRREMLRTFLMNSVDRLLNS